MTLKESLKKLVAEDKIKKLIDLLMDIFKDTEELNSVILLSARFSDINNSISLGITDNKTSRIEKSKITFSLLDLIDRIDDDQEFLQNKTNTNNNNTINVTGNNNQIYQDISNRSIREISNSDNVNTTAQNSRRVFISYNHKDKLIAEKLSNNLKLSGAKVIIDSEMMKAGENISNFIEKCILESDITLSIISNNSLLSSWVGIETINTFYHEKYSDKKFIACYTDDDFFDNKFRITATRKIDEKIKELDNLILEYMELKLDPTDLNNEKTRLFQLRNNLGDILQRLRNSLCIDINDNVFEDNIKRIISAINE